MSKIQLNRINDVYLYFERGYWFSGSTDVKLIREKIDHLCPASEKAALKQAFAHVLESFTWTPSGEPYGVDHTYLEPAPSPSALNATNAGSSSGTLESVDRDKSRALRASSAKGLSRTDSTVASPSPTQTFKMVIYQVKYVFRFLCYNLYCCRETKIGNSWSSTAC